MRLIDADALKAYAYESREWSHGGHPFVVEVDDIDDAPTIDPDDLRGKGEWTKTPERSIKSYLRRCSKCGKDSYFCGGEGCSYNFCPNCGAKMGGGSGGK